MGAATAGAAFPKPSSAQSASPIPRRIDVHHHCYPKLWFDKYRAQLLAADSDPEVLRDQLGYAPEMLRAINRDNAERLFPRFRA